MSGFKPGDLVTPLGWLEEPLELFAESRISYDGPVDIRVLGRLYPHGVALIIAVSRIDVYVIGSHGNGWTPNGFLKIVA